MKNKRIEFAYLWIVGRIFVSSFALFILFSTAYTATLYVGPGQPYTTIQAAVNAASAGDIIIVKDGTYTENVDVNKQLTIQSENGYNSTTVVAANSNDHVFEVTADYVTIEGFTIYGATGGERVGVYLSSNTDHCTISDNRCGYDSDHKNYFGIWLNYSDQNNITGNTSTSNGDGIRLTFSSDNTIYDNTCSNNSYGILLRNSSNNNTIYLNHFNNTVNNVWSFESTNTWHSPTEKTYYYTGSLTLNTSYIGNYYSDHDLTDSDGDGITDSAYDLPNSEPDDEYPMAATSNNYNFDYAATPHKLIYVSDDYSTIQAAVNVACPEDIIMVRDGTYTENVDVNKQLTIQSENGAGMTTVEVESSSDHVFEVNADYVTITGFTAYGATSSGKSGIYLGSGTDNCNISDNSASNNYYGIYLIYSSSNTLSGNTANSNNRSGIHLAYSSSISLTNNTANSNYTSGIMLYYSSDNTLTGNTANSNYSYGISLDYSSNNTLTNNTAKENNKLDLYVSASSDLHCSNTIENTTGSGDIPIGYYNSSANLADETFSELILCNADNSNINNVTIAGSSTKKNNGVLLIRTDLSTLANINSSDNYYGIYLSSSSNNNLTNNTANSNQRCGIYLSSSSNSILTDNTANSNSYGIWLTSSSNNNTLTRNTVNSNDNFGIYLDDSSNNTLTNNTAKENNQFDLYVYASSDLYYSNTIENTTGSGDRPIGYYNSSANLSDVTFSELILCNADNSNINNATIEGSSTKKNNGVLLMRTDFSTLANINSSDNYYGIYLRSSSNNNLTDNTANSNNSSGIYVGSSSNNNTISGNTANSNTRGIYVGYSSGNAIYLNDFTDNTTANVYSSGSTNTWHSPTSIYYSYASFHKNFMGNYYSDHTLTDSDGDGITDSYYDLPGSEPNDEYALANTSDHYSLQAWWLHSDNKMYQDDMTKAGGSVTISGGSFNIWIAETAELTTKYFSGIDSWIGQVVFTSTPTNGHTFTVEIGYSTDGSDFTAAGPDATMTGDGSATAFTYTTDAASVTVPQGKYLALRITNNNIGSNYNVLTGGAWSYTSSLPITTFVETNTASTGSIIYFNESGDGHGIDMNFTSLAGSGDVTVHQVNETPSNAPGANVCGYRWDISNEESITSFSVDLTFHYTDDDATGYTESAAFFGIAKFNSSTNTWQWLGGTVDAANNTVTVSGVTSFSTFALFRRIFGDISGDGYVDAADLQRLGDYWHETNSGEFTAGADARFFNFNKNTDAGGDQIIDAADLQVFGDCWHNGEQH